MTLWLYHYGVEAHTGWTRHMLTVREGWLSDVLVKGVL